MKSPHVVFLVRRARHTGRQRIQRTSGQCDGFNEVPSFHDLIFLSVLLELISPDSRIIVRFFPEPTMYGIRMAEFLLPINALLGEVDLFHDTIIISVS